MPSALANLNISGTSLNQDTIDKLRKFDEDALIKPLKTRVENNEQKQSDYNDLQEYNIVDLSVSEIKSFLKNINAYDTMASVVLMRKQDEKEFRVPFQGRYDKY